MHRGNRLAKYLQAGGVALVFGIPYGTITVRSVLK